VTEQLGFDLDLHPPTPVPGGPGMSGRPSAEPLPPDQAARERIRHDLDATLFVEAGAGAGKTSSLVARIANLVEGGVDITSIAAITFTEKAAAELRTRVRADLSARGTPAARDELGRLDHAPIGTLHSFARRILFDFPIEAGLPPGFTVLDELESGLEFEEQWDDLLDLLLDDPEPLGGLIEGGRAFVELCEFDGFGIRSGVRRIAQDFRSNWDLVDDRVDLDDPGPLRLDLGSLANSSDEIAAATVPIGDKQAEVIAEFANASELLRSETSLRVRLEAVHAAAERWGDRRSFPGNKTNWKKEFGPSGPDALEALRAQQAAFGAAAVAVRNEARQHRRTLLGAVVGRFVLRAALERSQAGRLEFHDLLVLARRLLVTRADVRAALHARYSRILLDEFQDTDPIQLEIAVRLSSRPDDPAQISGWRDLVPIPGRLFIVGDPKQSIYRFRRADIGQYLRAADQVGADRVTLSANFRSSRAVIEFVNDVFERLISFVPDSQPTFGALDACRASTLLDHGTVVVLGDEIFEPPDPADPTVDDADMGAADALRAAEAADVVSTITSALAEGWPVQDDDTGGLRPCRPGDICVLLPTRISLPALERELRAAEVAYRAENSSVVYATAEIRDLLLTLRAADDPTDALALAASLRSPLYGCSDVELWEWSNGGGSWNVWADAPTGLAGHPVAACCAHVRSIAERIGWTSPADLLAAVADERRLFDLALARRDARDVWRRLRYVVEQARAWADAGGHGVRRYLHWAALQASESRVADTILPEHDHDAVRVMTIHAAKGLEFPITVVAGLTTKPRRSQTAGVVWMNDSWMLAGRGDDGVFVDHQPIDEQMSDAERRRLLYVACTRAIDHLVVSLHRQPLSKANADGADEGKLTSAELLWSAGASNPTSGALVGRNDRRTVARPTPEALTLDWADSDTWSAERERVLVAASRRTAVAATRLAQEVAPHRSTTADPPSTQPRTRTTSRRAVAPDSGSLGADRLDADADAGLDKHPVNVELPPWQRGRYGTSIGRAVHGVLQFCDLDHGDDIDTLARAQCAAEGVLGLEAQVAASARSALRAPIVRSVVQGAAHWRELFVAAQVGDRVVEGYIDLLVRTPDGLVIVDYKTDQWSGPLQTNERLDRYRVQLAAYGAALESAIDEPVVGGVLVRCVPNGDADEIAIRDWVEAIDEVRRLVR
jgi:ATP-dependent helicase/nuclease subunit A